MKKSSLNKISKITLLFLTVTLIGSFCAQIASADHSDIMVAKEFSHTKSASSDVMPCCEENKDHLLAIFDLPVSKYPLQALMFMSAVISAGLVLLFANKFYKFSYSYSSLAPPGPDLLLTIIKRE